MKNFDRVSIQQGGKKSSSILHRIAHRLHYAMWGLLLLGLLLLFVGFYLEGLGLIVLAIIGFVVFAKLRDKTAPKDVFEADENGNAKPNYR